MRVTEPEKKEPSNSKYFLLSLYKSDLSPKSCYLAWYIHTYHWESHFEIVPAGLSVEFISDLN